MTQQDKRIIGRKELGMTDYHRIERGRLSTMKWLCVGGDDKRISKKV